MSLTGPKITFLVSAEFTEFCLEDSFTTIKTDLKDFYDANSSLSVLNAQNFAVNVRDLDEYEFYDRCKEVFTSLYENGGSIGSHSHNGVYTANKPFSWSQLSSSTTTDMPTPAESLIAKNKITQVWEDANTWVKAGVQEFYPDVSETDLSSIVNIRGSHLPDNTPTAPVSDSQLYHDLMKDYDFHLMEAGRMKNFMITFNIIL